MTDIKEDLRRYRRELNKIEPKYLALKDLVTSLETLQSLETAQRRELDLEDIKVEEGTFETLTTKAAALTALYLINATVKPVVVADLLESNGFEHESKNFTNTVNTALDRLSEKSLVEKVPGKGWRITDKGVAEVEHRLKHSKMESLMFDPTVS